MKISDRMNALGRKIGNFKQAVKVATRSKKQDTSTDTKENQAGFKDAMRQSGRASEVQKAAISQGEKALKSDKGKLDADMQRLNDAMGQHKPIVDEKALKEELKQMMENL